MTNFAVMHALPRIAESDPAAGYLTESLMAAIAQGDEEAKRRIRDFLSYFRPARPIMASRWWIISIRTMCLRNWPCSTCCR